MTTMHRRSLLAGTAALVAMPAVVRAATEAKNLTVAVPTDIATLDPANAGFTLDQSVSRLFIQGLFGFDKNMNPTPLLAESASPNEAATEFTFKLRSGVKFHDGTPFDAAAVKVNFERIANPANHLKRHDLLTSLDHVEVVDPLTAKLVLKAPFGALMHSIAHPSLGIQSPAALEKYKGHMDRNPVGTGPFTFVSWTPDTLKAQKNPNYWQPGWPKVDTITIRSVPEDGPRLAMLQAGEAQYIYPLQPAMVKVVQGNAALEIVAAPSIVPRIVTMNCLTKPFGDLRVRQALNYAVNKEALIKVVWGGYADPMDSPEPPLMDFHVNCAPYTYDVAKAKQLLAEAGYKDGFETQIWGQNTSLVNRNMEFLQQQFAAVGVKLNVEPLESGLFFSRLFSPAKPSDSKVEMSYIGPSASTGDADWQLRPLYTTGGFPPAGYNVSYFSDKAVDKDIKDGLLSAKPAIRAKAYADAQRRIWAAAPAVWLTIDRLLDAKSKHLHGAYRLPDGGLMLDESEFV